MRVARTIAEMREYIAEEKRHGQSVGLVPTMGFFHEGHLSLMNRARKDNNASVVSIFVNPTQFGAGEDFSEYPRDLDRDLEMSEEAGVDVVFTPSAEDMYPGSFQTSVAVTELSTGLCGASRPIHFAGVAVVVLKLFNIVQPDRAYFGMKDYQQLRVVQQMTRDLNLPVEVIGCPTVREEDGLAMSSRNVYLNQRERHAALVLSRSLAYAGDLLDSGLKSGDAIRRRVEEFINREPLARIDYVIAADPVTLQPLHIISGPVLLAMAVHIGKTRLIDNSILKAGA